MKVVVAGHVCLDIIPAFRGGGITLEPGRLIDVGAATLACGGGVANVGQALLKLGVDARLMGKVGDDAFGRIIETSLREVAPSNPDVVRSMKRAAGESTSYTVVLNPPGTDRMFLHHAGCNDTFTPEDVDLEAVAEADLFYFGYPPLMRRIYQEEGKAFAALLQQIKRLGVTTVLDMAMPDPQGPSGKSDWQLFLTRVLPHVDLFMPSLEEVCFMLGRRSPDPHDTTTLYPIADILLGLGARMVGLKLGEHGFYLRTAKLSSENDMVRAAPNALHVWAERELWSPVFEADVKGTTGAGDATIAGFITALTKGEPPERCLMLANAVGATSVEAIDSVSGVRSWQRVLERLEQGWLRATHPVNDRYWQPGRHGTYLGKHDRGGLL